MLVVHIVWWHWNSCVRDLTSNIIHPLGGCKLLGGCSGVVLTISLFIHIKETVSDRKLQKKKKHQWLETSTICTCDDKSHVCGIKINLSII